MAGCGEKLNEAAFDVIIVGTGLQESMLSAALACASVSVLHLDPNLFYGGAWSTLRIPTLAKLIKESADESWTSPSTDECPFDTSSCDSIIALPSATSALLPHGARLLTPAVERTESVESLLEETCVDLTPRPLMAAGELVDILVRTNVGHYIDFRALDSLHVHLGAGCGVQRVPAARRDVFTHNLLSVKEKRCLTRFVNKIVEPSSEEGEREEDGLQGIEGFREGMREMGVSERCERFLMHAVLFAKAEARPTMQEGRLGLRTFQQSLMRFGTRTPFLYANYGTGELAQAFCRLAAVHGATQVLGRGATHLGVCSLEGEKERGGLKVRTTQGDVVHGKKVFVGRWWNLEGRMGGWEVWRFVGVVDGSVLKDGEGARAMICVPRGTVGNEGSEVYVRQVDESVKVCRQGVFVVYAETVEEGGREEDVMKVAREFVDMGKGDKVEGEQERPKLLWGMTYMRRSGSDGDDRKKWRDVVEVVQGGEVEVDGGRVVEEVRRCFRTVVEDMDKEFLPERRQTEIAV